MIRLAFLCPCLMLAACSYTTRSVGSLRETTASFISNTSSKLSCSVTDPTGLLLASLSMEQTTKPDQATSAEAIRALADLARLGMSGAAPGPLGARQGARPAPPAPRQTLSCLPEAPASVPATSRVGAPLEARETAIPAPAPRPTAAAPWRHGLRLHGTIDAWTPGATYPDSHNDRLTLISLDARWARYRNDHGHVHRVTPARWAELVGGGAP